MMNWNQTIEDKSVSIYLQAVSNVITQIYYVINRIFSNNISLFLHNFSL